MLARHEVLISNGIPSESFYPGFEALRMLSPADRAALVAHCPRLADAPVEQAYGPRAKPVLRRAETLRLINDYFAKRRLTRVSGL